MLWLKYVVAARMATRDGDAGRYQRHRPEQTLLYQIVEEYYPAFTTHLTEQGRGLPGYVQREFEDYLKCGRLEHGFLRARCASCHAERPGRFQLQTKRLLSQLRRTAHGRKCGTVGR